MRTSGGFLAIFLRAACVVSPWRMASVSPSSSAYRAILRKMSLFRARRGVT